MSDVAGSFYIGMIIDGDSAQGNIRSTKPLVQMYQKDTGKCVPDWSVRLINLSSIRSCAQAMRM